MKPLYRIEHRQVGTAVFLSVVCVRGDYEVRSSEKVIPPVLEYDAEGNFKIIGAKEIVQGMHHHPYKPLTKEFNRERLADLEVHNLYKHLENFPTLPLEIVDGKSQTHPIAEYIYSSLVYLKPVPALAEYLNKIGYVQRCKILPRILSNLAANFNAVRGITLDLHSVPKRKVGTFCFIGDSETGISKAARTFAFGFERAIPCDRIARELSSLKSCERFLHPSKLPFELPERIQPYVTMLRVAIVGTEHSMLDSGDLYPSAIPKIACKLARHKIVKDVSTVEPELRNLTFKPFRSGIECFHQEENFVDEREEKPGTIRLILPGGVKVAAQLQDAQAVDSDGTPIDALMAFETFAKKGAVAIFAMADQSNYTKALSLEACISAFNELNQEVILVGDRRYLGYIVEVPVMRPGQRYTELSKASDQITVDLIAKALLRKDYVVRSHVEDEYQKLVTLRHAIIQEMISLGK